MCTLHVYSVYFENLYRIHHNESLLKRNEKKDFAHFLTSAFVSVEYNLKSCCSFLCETKNH